MKQWFNSLKNFLKRNYFLQRYLWIYLVLIALFSWIASGQPFFVEVASLGDLQYYEGIVSDSAQGTKEFNKKDLQRTIHYYEKLLLLMPNQHYAYNNMGYCYFQINNFSMALKSYDLAIKASPDIYTYSWNKGMVLFYLKRYKEAIRSFEDSLRAMPLTIEYYQDFVKKMNASKAPLEVKDILRSYLFMASERAKFDEAIAGFQIARSYFYLKKMDKMTEFLSPNLLVLSGEKDPVKRQKILANFVSIIERKYQQQLDVRDSLNFDFLFGPFVAKKMLLLKISVEKETVQE